MVLVNLCQIDRTAAMTNHNSLQMRLIHRDPPFGHGTVSLCDCGAVDGLLLLSLPRLGRVCKEEEEARNWLPGCSVYDERKVMSFPICSKPILSDKACHEPTSICHSIRIPVLLSFSLCI